MDDQKLRDAVLAYVYTVREALLYLHPADEFEAGIIAEALDATDKLASLATE